MDKLLSAVVLALSACAVGPNHVRPDTPAPERHAQADAALFTGAEAEAEFWRRLDDPLLTSLVDDALLLVLRKKAEAIWGKDEDV